MSFIDIGTQFNRTTRMPIDVSYVFTDLTALQTYLLPVASGGGLAYGGQIVAVGLHNPEVYVISRSASAPFTYTAAPLGGSADLDETVNASGADAGLLMRSADGEWRLGPSKVLDVTGPGGEPMIGLITPNEGQSLTWLNGGWGVGSGVMVTTQPPLNPPLGQLWLDTR
jgi:hypothetical protein